jgi:hypothetical protein
MSASAGHPKQYVSPCSAVALNCDPACAADNEQKARAQSNDMDSEKPGCIAILLSFFVMDQMNEGEACTLVAGSWFEADN